MVFMVISMVFMVTPCLFSKQLNETAACYQFYPTGSMLQASMRHSNLMPIWMHNFRTYGIMRCSFDIYGADEHSSGTVVPISRIRHRFMA